MALRPFTWLAGADPRLWGHCPGLAAEVPGTYLESRFGPGFFDLGT